MVPEQGTTVTDESEIRMNPLQIPNGRPTPNLYRLLAYIPKTWSSTDYVLCGSAALAFRGYRDVRDLDVLVRPSATIGAPPTDMMEEVERLDREGHWPVAPELSEAKLENDGALYAGSYRLRRTGEIDFFDGVPRLAPGVTVHEVFAHSKLFEGRRVVSLRHCLAIKALAFRRRDDDDMIALARFISHEAA